MLTKKIMKRINLYTFLIMLSLAFMTSCEEEDKRTVFPHSTPVFESTTIDESVVYGDSISFTVKVSDPLTPLSTLEVTLVANDKVIGYRTFITRGKNLELSEKIATEFLSGLDENGAVEVIMKLTNVEGDVTEKITKVSGKRVYFPTLYLVLENGDVIPLKPQSANPDIYESTSDLSLSNKITCRIAEKITSENEIDFSGRVWGVQDDQVQLINITGDFITVYKGRVKTTNQVIFDTHSFAANILGVEWPVIEQLKLSDFTDTTIDKEAFKTFTLYFEDGMNLSVADDFKDILFNLDYFERIDNNQVKYLGEASPLTLLYSATRKFIIVEEPMPEYPAILLVCGEGLGYPSKVKQEATSAWGFDNVLKYIAFRKIENNIYQGTVYLNAELANFKPFENSGWGNEKKSFDFTLPELFLNSIDAEDGESGNWFAAKDAKSGIYQITIDLGSKKATAKPVTLP